MARATIDSPAKEDLRNIFRQITRKDGRILTAGRVITDIRNHCDEHASHAASGHVLGTDRSDIAPGLRTFPHQRWIVLFRVVEKSILVLAVVDGSRDYDTLFLERSSSE